MKTIQPNNWGEYEEFRTVFKSIAETKFQTEAEGKSFARNNIDPFVYNFLKQKYGKKLQEHWNSCLIPKDGDKAIVIVERRCHPNLQFVLQNAAFFAPGYAIHVFCSQANEAFVKYICGCQVNSIHIHPIFTDCATPSQGLNEYNELLKKAAFWEFLQEEHILLMETDTYLLRKLPDTIYKYDYIAPKWCWRKTEPGGSGLSYRKRSAMLRICKEYEDKGYPQDCFANDGVVALKLNYPNSDDDNYLFTESIFSYEPVGIHQWWTFIYILPEQEWLGILQIYLTLTEI